jgi:hypothetical protein
LELILSQFNPHSFSQDRFEYYLPTNTRAPSDLKHEPPLKHLLYFLRDLELNLLFGAKAVINNKREKSTSEWNKCQNEWYNREERAGVVQSVQRLGTG